MDISFTNVLKGARQYFQGLPAAPGTDQLHLQQQHQQQQQQQRQLKQGRHRPNSSSENDGSVRSEQHSAVPVYWDQQNEGQAAANLTNARNAAALTMSHQQQTSNPPGAGSRPPLAANQATHNFPAYKNNSYAVSNGGIVGNNVSNKSGGGGGAVADSNHSHTAMYQSHISTVQAGGGSKTYHELQTNRSKTAYPPPTSNPKTNIDASRYYATGNSFYPPNGSSSSQDPQYNYKMQMSAASRTTSTSQHYPENFYHPPAGTGTATSSQQSHQAASRRQHLPVQPSNMYHHSNRNVVSSVTTKANSSSTAVAYNTANKSSTTPTNFNGMPNSYAYYPNVNFTSSGSSSSSNNTFTTSSSATSSRLTYVNTPHPPRPMKTTQNSNEYIPSPSPASTAVPIARMPLPKAKRESPLDLSVKTVRTSADSTLADDDRNYQIRRYDHPHHTTQQFSARPPKMLLPNFTMQPDVQQQPPQQQYPQHQQSQPPPRAAASSNNYYNYSYATSSPLPKVDFDFQQRKRSLEHAAPSGVPEKMPKVDIWRQNIDKQIDQRLSSYSKARIESTPSTLSQLQGHNNIPNGIPSSNSLPHQPPRLQQSLHPQQYPYYNPNIPSSHQQHSQPQQQQQLSGNKLKEATSTKPQATKKVLNLLRTSLQNKGAKTTTTMPTSKKHIEQLHTQAMPNHSYREVLQPSTDVMAPLQPKPGIVGRRNVSPFTAASLERNSNTPHTYKFHIPKAIDSVIISDGEKEQEASIAGNQADLDGLAAFLAARIRTKAELKQVSNNNDSRASVPVTSSSSSGILSTASVIIPTATSMPGSNTPPKLKKESSNITPPPVVAGIPKKLFGRSEMKRSEVRSSSETSVFDFPDSDNETDMPVLERQSLLNMRKDRKATTTATVITTSTTSNNDKLNGEKTIADEFASRPISPSSLLFQQACDNFLQQLKSGGGKKRGRRKKDDLKPEDETANVVTIDIKKEVLDEDVVVNPEILPVVKQEPPDATDSEYPNPSIDITSPTIADESKPKLPPTPDPSTIEPSEIGKHTDTDSDTPLVHIAIKQKKKFIKRESSDKPKKPKSKDRLITDFDNEKDKDIASSDSEVEKLSRCIKKQDFYDALKAPIAIYKPGKKPTFGDGSDFRPGWEEALYRYKKSIRIPMQLIQVTRPPSSQRLSTSLPDLDPCPVSPVQKTDILDSDMDSSNCSFSFSKLNYDSDQGSMRSFSSKCSILDKLLERYGGKKRKRIRTKEEFIAGPKIIPKSESELLPTPSLEIKDAIVKSTSALLGFRKKTVDNFKDAFINNSSKLVGVNSEFNTVVLKARTRTETRVLKEKATIREVFGEDRPASAPPVTCVDELKADEPTKGDKENQLKKEFNDVLIKAIENKKLEIIVENIKKEKDDDAVTVASNDSVETGGRKKGKLRRKFSSGFDYIRKKKKQIKKEGDEDLVAKTRRRGVLTKATPVSVDDIQKEIKQWVLNKGVGETHLHRASRCGYTDITAYCLEKMICNPSPKDNAGYTPLHVACAKGHLDIARLLLQYGAQVSESAQGGIRPLHEAAENGYVEIVRLLLSYGADPSLATYSGSTPLQLASDEATISVLQNHLDELQGKSNIPWLFNGPARLFDDTNEGFDPLNEVPESDPQSEAEDIEFEVSEYLLPNLYILPDCDPAERWMLLLDLSNVLKIKSKETLLRQLSITPATKSELVKEMKMNEFLEKAHCCQFMNANEKLNTRLSKIFLVKYTDKVKRLLNVENIKFTNGR